MYICINLAVLKPMAGLGNRDVIGPHPVDKRIICLNYFNEKEPTQWVIWGIMN